MRWFSGILCLLLPATAGAAVVVSDALPVEVRASVTVGPQRSLTIPLIDAKPGDRFEIQVEVKNAVYRDITAFITDQTNVNLFSQRQSFKYTGHLKAKAPIAIKATAWSYGTYFLVLDNSYAAVITKQVQYHARITVTMEAQARANLVKGLESVYEGLKRDYTFKEFNIYVRPCGQVNASSNPHITLCTELISQMVATNRTGAIVAILLHELGHTLLNVWGLPNYDNEDVADEFAAVMLLKNPKGVQALNQVMEWYSEHDVSAQVKAMVNKGDRHALSIQRIRNMQRLIADPKPAIARWNRLLYPQMTSTALQRIVTAPSVNDDVNLARQELDRRQQVSR